MVEAYQMLNANVCVVVQGQPGKMGKDGRSGEPGESVSTSTSGNATQLFIRCGYC